MASAADLPVDPGHVEAATHVRRLLMAVNGSERSERGLAQVKELSRALGLDVEVVEVLTQDPGGITPYLEGLARRYEITAVHTVVAEDPVDGLVAEMGYGAEVLGCVATAGHNRSAVLVGSVARSLLERIDQPVLLAGPDSSWPSASQAPVVAGVDGTEDDAVVAAVAAGWAHRLRRPLHLVSVVEPVPDHPEGQPLHRSHGPDRPTEYLQVLAHRIREAGVEPTTVVIENPVSVADPFIDECRRIDAALVVVGSRRHRGLRRVVLGDHAARIVHGSPALVLAVPLGLRR